MAVCLKKKKTGEEKPNHLRIRKRINGVAEDLGNGLMVLLTCFQNDAEPSWMKCGHTKLTAFDCPPERGWLIVLW